MSLWLRNVLVGIDQLANAIAGGDPDETISSRAAKRRQTCKACDWLCRILEKIDPRHCAESLEADEGKEAVIG
ncbi:MAG: hypothetical protein Q7U97_03705 [Rhodocyclaceae bacterium]|nr:hypothetical protein [Rhodocyclaceae bacterium]